MPLSFGSVLPIDITLTQGQAVTPFIMDSVMGGVSPSYYLTVPDGMSFNRASRQVSGSPTNPNIETHKYIAVEGNDAASVDVRFFVRRNIAEYIDPSFHDCIIFKYPINYIDEERNQESTDRNNIIQAIQDNNYSTFSDETSYKIVISTSILSSGSPSGPRTPITHIFIKSKNVDSMTPTFISGQNIDTISQFTFPSTIRSYGGMDVRIDHDGYQNILYKVPALTTGIPQATEVQLDFTGTGVEIYEVMILEEAIRLNGNGSKDDYGFTEIGWKISDRSSILQKDIADRITKVSGLNEDRWKWDIDYKVTFTGESLYQLDSDLDIYNNLINFLTNRQNNQFVVAGEYSRKPARVAPYAIPSPEIPDSFIDRYKDAGEELVFQFIEL